MLDQYSIGVFLFSHRKINAIFIICFLWITLFIMFSLLPPSPCNTCTAHLVTPPSSHQLIGNTIKDYLFSCYHLNLSGMVQMIYSLAAMFVSLCCCVFSNSDYLKSEIDIKLRLFLVYFICHMFVCVLYMVLYLFQVINVSPIDSKVL